MSHSRYSEDAVNVAMTHNTKKHHFTAAGTETELGNKAAEGVGVGGAFSGTLCSVAAGTAAVGTTNALQGSGLVIACSLSAAIASAVAATGGVVGTLIGWNMPDSVSNDTSKAFARLAS